MRAKVGVVKPKPRPDPRIPPAVRRVFFEMPFMQARLALVFERLPPIVKRWNKKVVMPTPSPRMRSIIVPHIATSLAAALKKHRPMKRRQMLWGKRKLIEIGWTPRKRGAKTTNGRRRYRSP